MFRVSTLAAWRSHRPLAALAPLVLPAARPQGREAPRAPGTTVTGHMPLGAGRSQVHARRRYRWSPFRAPIATDHVLIRNIVTAPPVAEAPVPGGTPKGNPVVLVDGRHTVYLKAVDTGRRTIRFDLIQFYGGDDAFREAAKDHPEALPDELRNWVPNDFYIRNVNPRLRTLPVRSDATVTVITFAWHGRHYSNDSVAVSLARLATYMPTGEVPFSITVRHGHVVKIAEHYVP
jgi:hypothetical protein